MEAIFWHHSERVGRGDAAWAAVRCREEHAAVRRSQCSACGQQKRAI